MELRHLRYAVAVAREGSFTRAAARLHLAQQALSQQVADLERELHLKLFERTRTGATPTAVGAAFLEDAQLILSQTLRAVARARSQDRGEAGRLRLGLGPNFQARATSIAELLLRFHQRYPEVEVAVVPMTTAGKLDVIRFGPLDVALTHGEPADTEDIAGELVWQEPLTGVLLPAGHPLAGKTPLWLRDLAEVPLLASPREAGAGLLDQILAALAARGLRPALCEVGVAGVFPDLVAALLADNGAWTPAVGPPAPANERRDVVFCGFADDPIPVGAWALWRRDDPSSLVSEFVEICRELRRSRRGAREPLASLLPVGRAG